ncbi:hypothetical protein [Alkaliphilus sp. B6464]|uniref:hypothetical protein n=1 Tax=Alkaliphilus sp. B6464 TaxID=2731219 RepID=UPI001BA4C90B|nr:hypothetical protein [Alkaliphilus sp. B6464]QUH21104.1 hypothetical protein HYG84_15255 [Alkaliphilus sp. B6464]
MRISTMPRRKKNAQRVYKPRKLKNVSRPKVVILPVCKSIDDGISPGKLKAVAEWR